MAIKKDVMQELKDTLGEEIVSRALGGKEALAADIETERVRLTKEYGAVFAELVVFVFHTKMLANSIQRGVTEEPSQLVAKVIGIHMMSLLELLYPETKNEKLKELMNEGEDVTDKLLSKQLARIIGKEKLQ